MSKEAEIAAIGKAAEAFTDYEQSQGRRGCVDLAAIERACKAYAGCALVGRGKPATHSDAECRLVAEIHHPEDGHARIVRLMDVWELPHGTKLYAMTEQQSGWQPIDTAHIGYDGKQFHHVLFRGRSKAGSFSGFVYVSGWMDHNRQPVHEYSYKLVIDAWRELPK